MKNVAASGERWARSERSVRLILTFNKTFTSGALHNYFFVGPALYTFYLGLGTCPTKPTTRNTIK